MKCTVIIAGLLLLWNTASAALQWKADLRLEYRLAENLDLVELDNSSFQTVYRTDDRMMLLDTRIRIRINTRVLDHLEIQTVLNTGGYWGNDSLAYHADGQALSFEKLSLRWDLAAVLSPLPLFQLYLEAGRQALSTMEQYLAPSYVFSDIGDALKLYWQTRRGWGVQGFLDFYSLNSPTYGMFAVDHDRHAYTIPYYDGEVNAYRWGINPFYRSVYRGGFVRHLEWSTYILGAVIGAVGDNSGEGGNEVSGAGLFGNSRDGDWLLVAGTGIYTRFRHAWMHAEAACSWGADYKEYPQAMRSVSGWHAQVNLALDALALGDNSLGWGGGVVYSSGPWSDIKGEVQNIGFVSLKGDRLGGMVMQDYRGLYPSAILNLSGIDLDWMSVSRRSGTMAIHSWQKLRLGPYTRAWYLKLEEWWYADTGLAQAEPVGGYLSALSSDQRVWGLALGFEVDFSLQLVLSRRWKLGCEAGIFFPLEYYQEALSVPTTVGKDPSTLVRFFCEVKL